MLDLDKSTWTRVRFGDVVTNVNETVKEPSATGIDKVIALDHLDPGELTIARYGDVADGTTFTRRVRPAQTLFGKRRAYQRKAAYAEVDAICSGDILVFEADPERLSPRLLPFLVHSDGFFDHALGTSAGSLSPRTSWKALAKYEVDLPPVDEQERIADLLWAVEKYASALAGSLNGLRAAAGVFLTRAADPTSPSAPLIDQFEHVIGGTWGDEPGTSDVEVLALGPKSYGDRIHVDVSTGTPRSLSSARAEKRVLKRGDIVLERSGGTATQPVGRVVQMSAEIPERVVPSDFQRLLRPRATGINPEYVFWRMWGNYESGAVRRYQRATTNIRNLDIPTYLSETTIPVPSREDQDAFVAQAHKLFAALGSVERQRAETMSLRSTLVASLLAGGPAANQREIR